MKICERIDGSVARFAQADEDIVDDGTPRIRNIEISSAFPRFCA